MATMTMRAAAPSIGTSSASPRSSASLPIPPRGPSPRASFLAPRAAASSSFPRLAPQPEDRTDDEPGVPLDNNDGDGADSKKQEGRGGNGGLSFKLEPTRKQQQRGGSRWSKGAGPGEYGGRPLDTKIRRSWGGNDVDPLTSAGEYIWRKNWQPSLDRPPADAPDAATLSAASRKKEVDSGFLSLNRAIALDSMDVDLSSELMKPSKATLQRQVEEAARSDLAANRKRSPEMLKWRAAPTRREEIKWAKNRKGPPVADRPRFDPNKEKYWYQQLKQNLVLLTAAIGGVGTATAYFGYSPEVTGSYVVGLVGSLVYIRMLGNSVDGLASTASTAGAARQALGAPRMLVPVVLTMFYNRWNSLAVPEFGVIHMQLIPMLLGFFAYKGATLMVTFAELLPSREEKDSSSSSQL